ncbi:MAG: hypothetical protein Q9195_006751 [Heterodermia aff. obscurata]
MAELGIVASIIQIADVGLRLSLRLYSFGETAASADKAIVSISKDVSLTSSVLQELGEHLRKDRDAPICSENAIKTAEEIGRECLLVFQELDGALEKSSKRLGVGGSKWISTVREKLRWPLLQPKMELLRNNLDRLRVTLLLMLNVMIYARQCSLKTAPDTQMEDQRRIIEDLARLKDEYATRLESIVSASPMERAMPGPYISTHVVDVSSPSADLDPIFVQISHYGHLINTLLEEVDIVQNRIDAELRIRIWNDIVHTHRRETSAMEGLYGYECLQKAMTGKAWDIFRTGLEPRYHSIIPSSPDILDSRTPAMVCASTTHDISPPPLPGIHSLPSSGPEQPYIFPRYGAIKITPPPPTSPLRSPSPPRISACLSIFPGAFDILESDLPAMVYEPTTDDVSPPLPGIHLLPSSGPEQPDIVPRHRASKTTPPPPASPLRFPGSSDIREVTTPYLGYASTGVDISPPPHTGIQASPSSGPEPPDSYRMHYSRITYPLGATSPPPASPPHYLSSSNIREVRTPTLGYGSSIDGISRPLWKSSETHASHSSKPEQTRQPDTSLPYHSSEATSLPPASPLRFSSSSDIREVKMPALGYASTADDSCPPPHTGRHYSPTFGLEKPESPQPDHPSGATSPPPASPPRFQPSNMDPDTMESPPSEANMDRDDEPYDLGYDLEVQDSDSRLPLANVSRIMKAALPSDTTISRDAKQTMQDCVSEFISFVTSEAVEKKKGKAVNGEDVLLAFDSLGFEHYAEALTVYLVGYRGVAREEVVASLDERRRSDERTGPETHQGQPHSARYHDDDAPPSPTFGIGDEGRSSEKQPRQPPTLARYHDDDARVLECGFDDAPVIDLGIGHARALDRVLDFGIDDPPLSNFGIAHESRSVVDELLAQWTTL